MATMDARLILAGQQPNLVNALQQGSQAAEQTNAVNDQNKLRQLYAQQGAGIANGDQNALNALAGLNPQASLDVQGSRLNMDNTRQVMDVREQTNARLSREEQRQIEAAAADLSAEERAAQAAKIEEGVKMGLMVQAPEEWDQMAIANGAPELVGKFDQREALAAKYMSVAEIMKGKRGPEDPTAIQTLRIRAQEAGLKPGTAEYQQFMMNGGPDKNGITITNPDGTVTQIGGSGGGGVPKLTVDAAKNSGFLIRTNKANEIINNLENEGTDFVQKNLDAVPLGAGNYFRDEDYQKFDQARRDFVNAILRRESGAVISEQEFDNANKQYFPVPGDGPEVIAQKRANRESAIAGLRVGSGEGAAYVDGLPGANDLTPEEKKFLEGN